MVGCLHAGTLGHSETGIPERATQNPLLFRHQGIRNSCLTKEAAFLTPDVLSCIISFVWGLILVCGGAKVCVHKGAEREWALAFPKHMCVAWRSASQVT